MKTSEHLSSFLNFSRELLKNYYKHVDELDIFEKETQDILHQIELGSYKSRNKFATRLATVRRKRRVVKDYVEINKELVSFLESNEFIKVHRKLENLLGTCRNEERRIENKRNYNAKVIKDLPISQGEENSG